MIDWEHLGFILHREAKEKEQEEASLKEEEQESAIKEEGEQQKEDGEQQKEEVTALEQKAETAAETKESSDEGASASTDGSLTAEEKEARAAVVLQSNFRGYQERKKFKERHKTQAGDELEVPTTSTSEEEEVAAEQKDEGKKEEEEEGKQDSAEGEADAPKQAEDEAEEKTVEGEDNDDSDHTQVPEEGEDQDEVSTVVGEEEMGEELAAVDEGQAEGAGGEGAVSVEDETKAATIIQSNFRGHRERKRLEEEGKLPARKKTEETPPEEKEASGTGDGPGEETPKDEASTAAKEEDASTAVDASTVDVQLEDPDEARAAVIIQSNFRGHKERKRLEEEGIIPKKNKSSDEVSAEGESAAAQEMEPPVESEPGLAAEFQGGEDEVKAATIIQSNYRGHRDRKKLKEEKEAMGQDGEEAVPPEGGGEGGTNVDEEAQEALDVTDVKVEHKEEEVDAEKERLEEEQAAVKIQSNYRGYKERKNLRATKESAQQDAEDFEAFSKDVRCPHLALCFTRNETDCGACLMAFSSTLLPFHRIG